MMTSSIYLVLLAVLLLVGVWSLVRGLRGTRINDHPVCGKCRFDLVGCPDDQKKCPECGFVLYPDKIRRGVRVRQPRLAALGVACVLMVAGMVGIPAISLFGGSGIYSHLPVWVLRLQAKHMSEQTRIAALDELLKRADADELSTNQLDAIANDAMAAQQNWDTPWLTQWGDLVLHAYDAGTLSPEEQTTYFKSGVRANYTTRSKIHQGDPLIIENDYIEIRYDSNTEVEITIHKLVNSTNDTSQVIGTNFISPQWSPSTALGHCIIHNNPYSETVGTNHLFIPWAATAQMFDQLQTVRFHTPTKITCVTRDVELIRLAEGTHDITAALHSPELRVYVRAQYDTGKTWLKWVFHVGIVPSNDMNRAYDVILKNDEHSEIHLGRISIPEDVTADSYGVHLSAQPWSRPHHIEELPAALFPSDYNKLPKSFDVILRPSREFAKQYTNIDVIHGAEVVFENVAVEVDDNSLQEWKQRNQ